jgi:hypothetical protein
VKTTANASEDYYGVGAEVTVASMQRAPDTTAGHRMQLIHMTTQDGLRWRDTAMYDTQEQVECYPGTLTDGSTRCLPAGGSTTSYFMNASCTIAIDLVEMGTGPASCGAPSVPKFASKYVPPTGGATCTDYEIHTVGAEYTGPVYTKSGTCKPYAPGQTMFYSVGPVVPTSDFAPATNLTDP